MTEIARVENRWHLNNEERGQPIAACMLKRPLGSDWNRFIASNPVVTAWHPAVAYAGEAARQIGHSRLAFILSRSETRRPYRAGGGNMAFAVIQEFPIEGEDRSTKNYDRVQELLGTRDNPPAGGLVHTAGFDEQAGVFRIFDVWESEADWNAFFNDRLMPAVRPQMEQGGRPPETRTYQLNDFMAAPSAGR